jgi:CDP-glycerol glycerophosphotransferase (TagB/SpsB family)
MGMNPERVLCLGGAQFDHYRRAPLQSAEEYKRQIGVPAGKKILVYAGSSKGLNETRHLEMLENAIQQGIIKNTVVLYRPHPWRAFPENEKDFFDMHFQHVIMDPNMVDCYKNYRGSNRLFIELADYEHTHTLLNAVDAVISPLSTILLEATMHGKPTAAYLPDEDMKQNKWLFTFSNMVHFREFFQHVDCLKCEDASRLVSDCKTLLDRAAQPGIAEKLKEQSKPFIYMSRESYGERVNQLVSDILAKRQVVGASKL